MEYVFVMVASFFLGVLFHRVFNNVEYVEEFESPLEFSSFVYSVEEEKNLFYAYNIENEFIGQSEDLDKLQEIVKEKYPYYTYYLLMKKMSLDDIKGDDLDEPV